MAKKDVSAVVSGMGVAMNIITELVAEVKKCGGTDEDIHRLATPKGEKLIEQFAKMIVGTGKVRGTEFLRPISGGQKLAIDATDGKEVLANANDIFAYIDKDFRNWKADEFSKATIATEVGVYELIKDAIFNQMFDNPEKLCLTQSQIIGFVRKHNNWLQTNGYATFFLFKSHNQFFVADVSVRSVGKLSVFVSRFEDSDVWFAGYRHRIVLPQLA